MTTRSRVRTLVAPLFPIGQIVATASIANSIPRRILRAALQRHALGDWGIISASDKRENDAAVNKYEQLLSAYLDQNGNKFWIVSDADRRTTTFLRPEEYLAMSHLRRLPDFYRTDMYARADKVKGVPREMAVRLYSTQSCTTWDLQVRAPIRVQGGEGKDFIVSAASLSRPDLVALRDAINAFLAEADALEAQ